MEITDVQIYIVNEDKLKAYATLTLEGCFVIRDLKIIKGQQGVFVAMPAKRRKDGSFRDLAHPTNKEMRIYLEEKVLEAYQKALKEDPEEDTDRLRSSGGYNSEQPMAQASATGTDPYSS